MPRGKGAGVSGPQFPAWGAVPLPESRFSFHKPVPEESLATRSQPAQPLTPSPPAASPPSCDPSCRLTPLLSAQLRREGRGEAFHVDNFTLSNLPPGEDAKRPPTLKRFGVEGFQR